MKRRWKLLPRDEDALKLAERIGLPPVFGQLLANRGLRTEEEVERFLFPSLSHLTDPFLMKGMEEGVKRATRAILSGEKVVVYGDYDVDGITSSALLKLFLADCGLEASAYIPKRLQEGYGLNPEAVKEIGAQGTRLLVSVDCGVTDRQEVELARRLGMDVIILDHHEPPEELPPAIVIDPLQRNCPYPFKGLAGVGVTFAFVMALRKELRELGHWRRRPEPNLKRYLDLVALGTVADVVPVIGENRVLLKFGLEELSRTRRPGLVALKELSGLSEGPVDYGHVAFRLAPRINAGGRMEREDVPLKLLLTQDPEEAKRFAEELEEANRERQALQEQIYREAKEMAETLEGEWALVLCSEDWHPGVIGIVASKIAEEFWLPTVLIALDGREGKGSGRSIPELHLRDALKRCSEHLIAFGGHRAAAGLKVLREEVPLFREAFREAVKLSLGERPIPTLYLDAELSLGQIDLRFTEFLELLPPYGPGNPRPLFCSAQDLILEGVRRLGNDTVRFSVREGSRSYEAISFGGFPEELPQRAKIAFHPRTEQWEGYKRIVFEVRDLQEASS